VSINKKIYIAGHKGMVGSAIERLLRYKGHTNIITMSRNDLDLTSQEKVNQFFKQERPEEVYLAAAKVGGIHANNTYPADFIYQNLMIESNIIHACYLNNIKKILFLGSSCIYPKDASQPIAENQLLTGLLEPTNEAYAIAKIAGIKLCESYNMQHQDKKLDYRCVMPTNLYGPGDNYHPQNSHVIPGLIRRFHEAKVNNLPVVEIWGTGKPRREFLHVDDMASACIHVMNLSSKKYLTEVRSNCSHLNIGYGKDISIMELAELIKKIIGFKGDIQNNLSMPDGTPRKLLDVRKINKLGWFPAISLENGIELTYRNFLENFE